MAALYAVELLFDDLQQFHGASLDTDAAGDALGHRIAFPMNHNLHGAYLNTLAAANALLLVDHVHAGLGVLSNGLMLANLHALAALDAYIGLGAFTLCNNLDAGIVLMEFLVESLGAGSNALQAGHTGNVLLNREFLHRRGFSFMYILFVPYYTIFR